MSDIPSNLPTQDTSDGSSGAAVPSTIQQVGGKDNSGNLQPIKIDANGGLVVAGEGTAGSPSGGVVSIQGVLSGTPIPASQSGTWTVNSKTQDGSGNAIGSTTGALNVNVVNSFAAGTADRTSFTYGTSIENAIGGVYNDSGTTVTTGQQAAVRITAERAFHSNLRNSSGTEIGVAANPIASSGYGNSLSGSAVALKSSSISAGNSTSTPLGSNATFTGAWENVLGFTNISVMIKTDQISATDGFVLEFSTDGSTVVDNDQYTIPANNGQTITQGVNSQYFRVRYTNGSVAQSSFIIQVLYHISAPKASSHRIADALNGQNDSELVKAVLASPDPNDSYVNLRAQGSHTGNSTSTPLAANTTFRGTWFPWQMYYVKLVTDLRSDVSGTLFIDFTEATTPTDGVDTDVQASLSFPYDPTSEPILKRSTPVQSKWVRHRYINGNAAQSIFQLDGAFLVSDSGIPTQSLKILPISNNQAGIVRSVSAIPNVAGTAYVEVPVGADGSPKTTVSDIQDDILYRPLSNWAATQVIVGITPTRLDLSQIADRRMIGLLNPGPGFGAVGNSNSITYDSSSFVLPPGVLLSFTASNDVQWWGIAQNTGGTQTTLDRNPGAASATSGSPTNPSNVLSSNNTYAVFTAQTQAITATTYTAGTSNTLVAVKLGIEGNKQSGQTEIVTFQDVVTGSATSSGTINSGTVTAVTNHLYLAAISRESTAIVVNTVTGLGLTWTKIVQQNSDDSNRALDVWYAIGTVSGNGAVTASFASSASEAHISVARYSNVDTTTPIQASASANGSSTTPSAGGIAGTNKGYSYMAAAIDNATSFTAGSGYTNVSTAFSGDSLGVLHKALTSTGTDTPTATLNASKHWAAISLTLTPRVAIDPVITLSYTLSGSPGATTGTATFTSSTDATTLVDVTPDRTWVVANIPNVNVIATATTLSGAQANIDWIFLELIDSTGNTVRVSVMQAGRAMS